MTNLCQKVALAGAATVAVAATIIMAESASAQSVAICQSVNFETIRCSINTRRGVFLERQLSRAACIEGIDWTYGRGFVWVRNGCRAEFRSGDVSDNWNAPDEEICCIQECYQPPRRRQGVRRPRRIPRCP
ncbi:DUF3011 domain-containing protein [Aerosakkonemataceae cyanobacterium BLCC-F50]|uniref:DUF3011 domain-containing protein n=1 Tax=Floridaenema flaviceps BLCC-F50 TaxID=3153642 RepID=A0ABV4XQ39_9CYAN